MRTIWVTLESGGLVKFHVPKGAGFDEIRKLLNKKYGSDNWLGWSNN